MERKSNNQKIYLIFLIYIVVLLFIEL